VAFALRQRAYHQVKRGNPNFPHFQGTATLKRKFFRVQVIIKFELREIKF